MRLTVRAACTEDDIVAGVGDLAKEDHDEGGSDDPVGIASIEELPATRDGGPALARKHGEVRHGGEAADVGGEVIVPIQCNHTWSIPVLRTKDDRLYQLATPHGNPCNAFCN
jgi:hypothetical protein